MSAIWHPESNPLFYHSQIAVVLMMGVGLCNSYCRLWILFLESAGCVGMLSATGSSCMVEIAVIMHCYHC